MSSTCLTKARIATAASSIWSGDSEFELLNRGAVGAYVELRQCNPAEAGGG